MKDPLVSIACTTYNHENYIKNAIEGFLMQRTTFPLEIIIYDDASKDNTQQIIREYSLINDNIITFLQKENQWSKGKYGLIDYIFPIARGKYITLCEGDDYWTDPYKLQRQVDFLEANPDYGLVCTDIQVVDENNIYIDWPPLIDVRKRYKNGYIFFDQFEGSTINTLTACFRASLIEEVLSYKNFWYIVDFWLWLRISMKSKVKYLDYVSAHYRRHNGNFTSHENVKSYLFQKQINYAIWDNLVYYFNNRKNLPVKPIGVDLLKHSLRLVIKPFISFHDKLDLLPLIFRYSIFTPALILIYFKKFLNANS